jgi:hypothetical protein
MVELDRKTEQADLIQTSILRTKSLILVDEDDNPVIELRGGADHTLQLMDKHGNICAEIHLGQTPGKELGPTRLTPQ